MTGACVQHTLTHTSTHTHGSKQAQKRSYILQFPRSYICRSLYKCFIRKVIDNPKRRLLHQIVSVYSCPDLAGWGLRSPYWWGLESLLLSSSSSSLQRNQAFVFTVLRNNSFRSSIKSIEKLFCPIKLTNLSFLLMFRSLLQDKYGKSKSIKIGCLPSLPFLKFLPEINTKKWLSYFKWGFIPFQLVVSQRLNFVLFAFDSQYY